MWIENIDADGKRLEIAVPLTNATGKTRIKTRSFFNEYGFPVATRQTPFTQSCYVEWQIGYDVVIAETDKLEMTTLKNAQFTGANGKEKALYELSEYVYYFHKWGVITAEELRSIRDFLKELLAAMTFSTRIPGWQLSGAILCQKLLTA
jgi:hypothetical protein